MNERARAMERRLQWPMLVAALLVVPAIAIEQSEVTGALNTVAVVINLDDVARVPHRGGADALGGR